MDKLQEILARLGMETTSSLSPREYEQFKVDGMNNTVGDRDKQDGYNCDICKNKGFVAELVEEPNGSYSHTCVVCKCETIRRSIMRMKRSGLKDIIKDYTFDKFIASESWQKTIKTAAVEYSKHPEGWFFLGGQSGAGKTHLCTAICREFLLSGRQVVYMLWRDEIVKLKGSVNEADEYTSLIDKYKNAEVLYIDDLFKTGKAADNTVQRPTGADISVAFEILNYRALNPALLTIISTECTEDELLDIDEALAGRIIEKSTENPLMSNTFSIAKDRNRNYRIRKAVTL